MYFPALIVIQFFKQKSYYIDIDKHKGVLKMLPKQKILSIRLSEKILKNPDYAKSIGVKINKIYHKKNNGKMLLWCGK